MRAEFYRKNYFDKFKKLRKNKKKFSIIFSGTNHPDWYEQFKWPINSNANENILTKSNKLLIYCHFSTLVGSNPITRAWNQFFNQSITVIKIPECTGDYYSARVLNAVNICNRGNS